MALCVCKCLNVSIQCDSLEDVSQYELNLSSVEQRDLFFHEPLIAAKAKLNLTQQALVTTKPVGNWTVNICLACGQSTHAQSNDTSRIIVNAGLKTTKEEVENLKKSDQYSDIFKLLVPNFTVGSDSKESSNQIEPYERMQTVNMQNAIGSLSRQLTRSLQSELEAVEEAVRQFREKKYAEFEVLKEKAHKDHKALANSIIEKARFVASNVDNLPMDDDNSLSPYLQGSERRRLSSFKAVKKPKRNSVKSLSHYLGQEDSLDSEGIFDLEGMDSSTPPHNDLNSDEDDSDSDSSERDEGIHVARGSAPRPAVARSLPMKVPRFPHADDSEHLNSDDEVGGTKDIAASIKALARSVHGDVFGDLPRPRFSTQI